MNTSSAILVVSDEAANVKIIADHLNKHGYRTLVAHNGEIGIELAVNGRPDLILLDMVLPEMNGFETCRRLKAAAATKEIPVIFMCAPNGSDDIANGFSVGAVDYISKPFQVEEALARIRTHLRLRELNEQLEEQQSLFSKALNRITDSILAHGDIESMLNALTQIIGETLQVDRSLIYDIRFEEQLIVGLCEWLNPKAPDITPTKDIYPLNSFRNGNNFINETHCWLESHTDEQNLHLIEDGSVQMLHEQMGIQSLLWYPVAFHNNGYYVLAFNQVTYRRHWQPNEMTFLDVATRQVNLALQKSTLLAERKQAEKSQRRYIAGLEALRQVGLEITAQLELDNLLGSIVSQAIDLVGGDAGGLCFYRPEQGILQWDINVGSDTALQGLILQRGEGVAGRVWQSGKPMIIDDYKEWQGRAAIYEKLNLTAIVAAPVQWGDEFLGVLSITAKTPAAFTTNDAELLHLFALQAAIAIRNARLHTQAQQHTAELEQRVAERTAELEIALELAQSADRMKSQFISDVNHELRTPLSNIKLYINLLEQGRQEKWPSYIEILKQESTRLQTLIENMLDISRLDAEKTAVNLTPTNLNHQIATLLLDQGKLNLSEKVTLDFKPDEAIPNALADPQLLYQALTNLLANAINYTPTGGAITLQTGTVELNNRTWVTISVADTGLGISEAEQTSIFNRFYRGVSGRDSGVSGTGLGLSICQEIMKRHGGKLTVDSVVGKGSTFTLWLQRVLDDE